MHHRLGDGAAQVSKARNTTSERRSQKSSQGLRSMQNEENKGIVEKATIPFSRFSS
jgi:hypothetical protein